MQNLKHLTPEQYQRVNELNQMSPQQWDALCKKCGICCLLKTNLDGGNIAYLSKCCQYLNKETKQCEIYPNRLNTRGANCAKVTLDIVLDGELVPQTCGYIEYIYGPASEQINLDWSMVTKHEPGTRLTLQDIIADSVLWNRR